MPPDWSFCCDYTAVTAVILSTCLAPWIAGIPRWLHITAEGFGVPSQMLFFLSGNTLHVSSLWVEAILLVSCWICASINAFYRAVNWKTRDITSYRPVKHQAFPIINSWGMRIAVCVGRGVTASMYHVSSQACPWLVCLAIRTSESFS